MKFKYHKSYRGYYLTENGKFKRPFEKLDLEKTTALLEDNNISVEFSKNKEIDILEKYVVFINKNTTHKNSNRSKENFHNLEKLELEYKIPELLLENLILTLEKNALDANKYLKSILSIIRNIMATDILFEAKVKKIFFYNKDDLKLILRHYSIEEASIERLKKEIELNYPRQYISNLPLDYKEQEMIFVFYFIMLVELITVLK